MAGLLCEQAGPWFYKRGEGNGAFGRARLLARRPSTGLAGARLADLDGNGRLDPVRTRGLAGYFERDTDGDGWDAFRPFAGMPNVDFDDPNARLIDLDGDGHADLLVTEQHVLRWYPSQAKDGFGREEHRVVVGHDEELGPAVVFANEGSRSSWPT